MQTNWLFATKPSNFDKGAIHKLCRLTREIALKKICYIYTLLNKKENRGVGGGHKLPI